MKMNNKRKEIKKGLAVGLAASMLFSGCAPTHTPVAPSTAPSVEGTVKVEKETVVETVSTVSNINDEMIDFYKQLSLDMKLFTEIPYPWNVYTPYDELSYEELTHRVENGNIAYLEFTCAEILNEAGDCRIINTKPGFGDYIKIPEDEAKERLGEVAFIYCIYNPNTNWDDDVVERWNFYPCDLLPSGSSMHDLMVEGYVG